MKQAFHHLRLFIECFFSTRLSSRSNGSYYTRAFGPAFVTNHRSMCFRTSHLRLHVLISMYKTSVCSRSTVSLGSYLYISVHVFLISGTRSALSCHVVRAAMPACYNAEYLCRQWGFASCCHGYSSMLRSGCR